jgi:hypothetical protein
MLTRRGGSYVLPAARKRAHSSGAAQQRSQQRARRDKPAPSMAGSVSAAGVRGRRPPRRRGARRWCATQVPAETVLTTNRMGTSAREL